MTLDVSQEADWIRRSTGAGVVWAHNFETAAEVNQFRWRTGPGADPDDNYMPGYTTWSSGGFGAGGILKIRRDPNTSGDQSKEPPEWWRPLAPLDADSNGIGTADAALGGTLTRRAYDPYSGSAATVFQNFGAYGYYGHSDYHSGGTFDGTGFWLQFRCRRPSERFDASNPDGGKILFICTNEASNCHQTHVLQASKDGHSSTKLVGMYNHYDGGSNSYEGQMGTGTYGYQPGNANGSYSDGLCDKYDTGGKWVNCFQWPVDEWITVMVYHAPGHDGVFDGVTQLFIAPEGYQDFIRVLYCDGLKNGFSSTSGVFGVNAIMLSAFSNGATQSIVTGFTEQYQEVILSQDWIPCPSPFAT